MNIKMSGGDKEGGVVFGNAYDKYGSSNPIVKRLMSRFESSLYKFILQCSPKSIHEIGCGEGYWVLRWHKEGFLVRGCDFSNNVINIAQENAISHGFPPELFQVKSIYDLNGKHDLADLIVCCEVLEHLQNPEEGLRALQGIVERNLIISVPQEPLWRVLNLLRGKYVKSLGNTPGHIQHWSRKKFIELVSKYFEVVEVSNPLPWTMLLCRKKL